MKEDTFIRVESLLKKKFGDKINFFREFNELTLEICSSIVLSVSKILKNDPSCLYEQLIDLCGIDYLHFGVGSWDTYGAKYNAYSRAVNINKNDINKNMDKRFAVVYHLLSLTNNSRIRVRYFVSESMEVNSVTKTWPSANWFEREAFDLFGIKFNGHNNLHRILTDYNFKGNPLRKDFPLIGNVEVRYDDSKQDIVYEPVSIEHRENTPKIIRG